MIGDSVAYPSYVGVSPSGNLAYTWASSTGDVRALQKGSYSDRIASCWYTSGAMLIDLQFRDTNRHQVALYMLDWDGYSGGRTQRVDVVDANGTVLDTRPASAFGGGEYLVWNLSGHVALRVTNTNPSGNAVIGGLFFGAGGAVSQPPTGTAAFLRTDSTTAGSWKGVYGADGYNVIGDTAVNASYAAVTPTGNSSYIWAGSTGAVQALQKASSTTDRLAACWYTPGTMSVDINLTDSSTHQVALYFLDWDGYGGGRSERVDVLDANGTVLDTRSVTVFAGGQYVVWNLSGHVAIRITNSNSSSNAVISGVFFGGAGAVGPPPATAAFLRVDSTTQGTWKGIYGADGYNVIGDAGTYPSYATVSPSGNLFYVWQGSTTDLRALQKPSSATDRIASCWYTDSTMTVDINLTDTSVHQVALYFLDWDSYGGGRTQRVDILNGNGTVLDTRSVGGFAGGQYWVWNLSGHVVIRITNTNPAGNATLDGLFFR